MKRIPIAVVGLNWGAAVIKRLLTGPTPTTVAAGSTGDLHHFAGPLNRLILGWVRGENALLRYVNLPVGVSVFALAQKPA